MITLSVIIQIVSLFGLRLAVLRSGSGGRSSPAGDQVVEGDVSASRATVVIGGRVETPALHYFSESGPKKEQKFELDLLKLLAKFKILFSII
jgi:hypothetical protein